MLTYVKLTGTFTPHNTDNNISLPSGLAANLLRIDATDASDNPVDLFVYVTEVLDLYEETSSNPTVISALFQNVASPNDYEELPVGVPDPEDEVANDQFMLSYIEILTRSRDEAEFVWNEVVADVRGLVRHFQLLLDPPTGSTQTLIEEIE